MKNNLIILVAIIFTVSLLSTSCKKAKTGIDALPEATQEGENKFGCIVNGVEVLPRKTGPGDLYSSLSCLYNVEDKVFLLSCNDGKHKRRASVRFESYGLAITEGVHPLTNKSSGTYMAQYSDNSLKSYKVKSPSSGELTITKHDETLRIIAGTFWFNAVDEDGATVQVREGRFDVIY